MARKTKLGCTILEGNDIADLPTVSENNEILEEEILKNSDNRHNHTNKNVLDSLSDVDGKLKYNEQDIGIGDMTKAEYDVDGDGKVDIANDSDKLGGQLPSHYADKSYVDTELNNKVDKVTGKGLSTNDYTNEEKQKNQDNADNISKVEQDLVSHKADYVHLKNRVDNLKTNDIEARREILDIKLKLDEMKIIDYLNKTGIGFYDLFTDTENIDTANTTATVDTSNTDVTFKGQQLLKMTQQNFDSIFNDLELSIYDKERKDVTVDNTVSNTNQIQTTISPGSVVVGDSFYYNGEVYTVSGVQEV